MAAGKPVYRCYYVYQTFVNTISLVLLSLVLIGNFLNFTIPAITLPMIIYNLTGLWDCTNMCNQSIYKCVLGWQFSPSKYVFVVKFIVSVCFSVLNFATLHIFGWINAVNFLLYSIVTVVLVFRPPSGCFCKDFQVMESEGTNGNEIELRDAGAAENQI